MANGHVTVSMTDLKSKEWIVTDSIGTPPLTITAAGTYIYGTYPNGTVVTLKVTDSIRPECSTTTVWTINCP